MQTLKIIQYVDWESGRKCFYYCHVYGDGSYSFKGPCLNTTKTHLQRELGDDNVLIVKFLGEEKHSVTKIANEGILVGFRRYCFFVFKDESNDVKKKDRMEKDKSSTFTGVKCYFVRFDSLAPCNGSESYILSSRSIYEARCLFMHVHMVSSMAKYMARFSLILSKTIKLPVDLSTVEVVQIEDIPCRDENGCIICGEDGEPCILTDGTGFISEDLALQSPEDFGRARFVRDRDFQINVPSDLIPAEYPHFMQRDGSCSYHSTSILGEIYDKLEKFQSNVCTVGEVWKLPAFEVAVDERCFKKWTELYNQYRRDMTEALKRSQDLKNSAADEVIMKYKQLLYEAEDFQESRKDIEELYNEALAIYHVSYNLAISKGEVGKCGFAWKVAGAALCNLHASTGKGYPIRILPSLLRDILT